MANLFIVVSRTGPNTVRNEGIFTALPDAEREQGIFRDAWIETHMLDGKVIDEHLSSPSPTRPPLQARTPELTFLVRTFTPNNFADCEFDNMTEVIRSGGAVEPSHAREELPKAKRIAVAYLNGKMVGVAALKRDRPDYAREIAERSAYPFPDTTDEIGYVAVLPAYRGHRLSERMLSKLIEHSPGALFGTTSTEAMKAVNVKLGFVQCGREWPGRTAPLTLWIRS